MINGDLQPQAGTTISESDKNPSSQLVQENLPPPPPPRFTEDVEPTTGNQSSTEGAAATIPTTIRGTPQQQSIEEFAMADNSFGNSHQPTLLQPATSIAIPILNEDDDHATCVSSITSPFRQNSDLFVGSLYPSTREINEAWDRVLANNLMSGGTSGDSSSSSSSSSGGGGGGGMIYRRPTSTASSCSTKATRISRPTSGTLPAMEERMIRMKGTAAKKIVSTTIAPGQQQHIKTQSALLEAKQEYSSQATPRASHTNTGGDFGPGELGKSESLMLTKGQETDKDDSSTSQTHQQGGSTPTTFDSVFMRMMQVPAISHWTLSGLMPLPPRSATIRDVPVGPGAHPIATPLTSHPLVPSDETTAGACQTILVVEESKESSDFNCNNNNMGLAEAHPVDALPEARVEEELIFGEEQQEQQSMKKGQGKSLWGHIAGLSWHWRCILMLLCSAMAANWVVVAIRRIVAWNHDPVMVRTRQSIEDVFGKDYFDSELKEKTLHWIVHEDPMLQDMDVEVRQDNHVLLDNNKNRLIQRFSLAAFHFQTSARQPWSYCNPPKDKQSDVCFPPRNILKSAIQSAGTRWLSATHECQWMGLSCERGSKTVSTLRLPNNNITGPLPSELTKLSNLQRLELVENQLSGSLPVWITQMTSLQSLYLSRNAFAGSIPPEFFQSFSHTKLYLGLGSNLLTGQLPSQIGLFGGQYIWLGHNLLTGPIPDETYNLTHLQQLNLRQNSLTGTISTLVGQLTQLTYLYLDHSELFHTIPTEIGLMGSLDTLNLARTNIDGTIPEELYSLKGMSTLDISDTNIGGTISSHIGWMTKLDTCLLANTKIGGTIPEQLFSLPMMQSFHANGNPQLSGSIPEKLCTNKYQQDQIIVDCSPSSSSGKPSVECPKRCCSSCCDAETKICSEQ